MRVNYPFVTERHKVLINSPSRKLWPPTSSYCEISRSQFLDLQNFKQCFSLIYHDDVFHKKQSFSFKKISFISVVIVGESVVFPPPPPSTHTHFLLLLRFWIWRLRQRRYDSNRKHPQNVLMEHSVLRIVKSYFHTLNVKQVTNTKTWRQHYAHLNAGWSNSHHHSSY